MADEAILTFGTWATVQAANSTADGAVSTGTLTDITTALSTGSEANYPLLDLKLAVSSGTPALDGTVDVYLRGKADTDEAPIPATDHLRIYVGSFVMDNTASSEYYLYGVANLDPLGKLYMLNNDGVSTLTIALKARGRTYEPAV